MISRSLLFALTTAATCLYGCGPSQLTPGSWIPLGGPYAREVAAILADPTHPGTVYAALTNGDIYSSENDGTRWDGIVSLGGDVLPYRFTVVGENPPIIAVLTNRGLYRAPEEGLRWIPMATPPLPRRTGIHALMIDPWKTSTWFIGTTGYGIYKSDDSGHSWVASNGSLPGLSSSIVADLAVDPSAPNEIVAAVDGLGLVLSTDFGKEWTRLTEGFTPTGSQIIRVFRDGNTIVYATNSGSVVRSVDGGHSWIPSIEAHEGSAAFSFERSFRSPRILTIGTAEGPLESSDFGSTWKDLAGTLPHLPCSVASRHDPASAGFFVFGEAIGLQRTSDHGMHWDAADHALGGSTIHHLSTDEDCGLIYAAITRSVMTYNAATETWSNPGVGLKGDSVRDICVSMTNPLIAVSATDLTAFKTLDGGKTWRELSTRLPFVATSLEMCPRVGTRVLAASDEGVFISTDAGLSWAHSQPVSERYDVRSFTFMPTDVSIVYAATANTASIISHDGGFHWEPSRYGIDTRSIGLITLDDLNREVAYAWTPRGESYRSTNGGMEWNRYAPPWNPTDTVLLAADRFVPSKIVAIVNNRSLYYTAAGGGTWYPLDIHDIPGTITAALWSEKTGVLYAAVLHRGLYMVPLRGMIASLTGD